MTVVSLVKCNDYQAPGLDGAVRRAVDLAGGLESLVKPGDRVLIKPNMLSADAPEKRITTDPAVVLAVGRLVLEAGGRPVIADSPAVDRFKRVAEKSGLAETAQELGAEIFPLTNPTRVDVPGDSVYKSLEIAAQAIEADVVVNLPKLKTHSQMLMTLGVKNMFGTIVGQRKMEWHGMVGVDRVAFASLLLDIHATVKPALTVLDGVWGMEGRGPANGPPRHIGLIAASTEALALDLAVCRLLGIPLKKFPLYRAALKRKLIDPDLKEINLVGDDPEDLKINDFQIPDLEAILPVPKFLAGLYARHMVSKPIQNHKICVSCAKCTDMCSVQAIALNDKKLTFNYDRCIRCYCCQEVCPQGAIGFKTGPLVRLLNRFGR